MTALLFKPVHKDAGPGNVHVTTAIGNERPRRRFKPRLPLIKRVDAWSTPLDIRKIQPDKQLIFGWASVVEKAGVAVVDSQDDIIPVSELENAAYEFVLHSRQQGDMHATVGVGRLVESMVFTKEKQDVLGIDLGMVAWWTGFRVDCPDVWAAHKRGDRPEFSIGGQAIPVVS